MKTIEQIRKEIQDLAAERSSATPLTPEEAHYNDLVDAGMMALAWAETQPNNEDGESLSEFIRRVRTYPPRS